jgi:AcrR family transcriptional regulator
VVTFLEGALVSRAAVWPAGPRPHEPWADTGDEERDRLLAAVVTLAADRPYCELTAAAIRAEARVTRRSFDAHFDGVGDCFLAAAHSMVLASARRAEGQARLAASWEGGLYRAAFMLLLEIGRTPELAKLGFVELFEPGRDGMHCRSELISIGARRLRETAPSSRRPGELAAEATMAAACQLVDQRLAAGDREVLPRLAPLIAYLSLAPVLGADTALAAIRAEQECCSDSAPRRRRNTHPGTRAERSRQNTTWTIRRIGSRRRHGRHIQRSEGVKTHFLTVG